jgi:hypothetical protein
VNSYFLNHYQKIILVFPLIDGGERGAGHAVLACGGMAQSGHPLNQNYRGDSGRGLNVVGIPALSGGEDVNVW